MRSLAASLLVFALLLVGFDAVFLVDAGSRAVVTSPVSGVRNNIGPGLHVKWPLIDRLEVVPERVLIDANLRHTSNDGRELAQSVWMLASVRDAAAYADALRKDPEAVNTALTKTLQEVAAPAAARQTFAQILADGGKSLSSDNGAVDAAAAKLGLVIRERGTGTLGFPAGSVSASNVQDAMKASEGKVVEQARINAADEVQQAGADSALERIRLLSEAHSNADTLRAEGQAEAARILAEAGAADPRAAAFDRAAQAYRRARAAGQAISADDPALRALRNND